jgi:hypothetical protein
MLSALAFQRRLERVVHKFSEPKLNGVCMTKEKQKTDKKVLKPATKTLKEKRNEKKEKKAK